MPTVPEFILHSIVVHKKIKQERLLRLKFRVLLLLFSLILIFNFSSCSSSESSYAFKYAVEGNPKTLDPQCALNDSSQAVISAVFQGLFTFGENGKIEKGMIDSFDVSDDGTVWTFYLQSGVFWSDGGDFSAECTAEDFVFAFQRLFRPATKSERAGEYYIIKNAEKINKGSITDMSQLGVRTIDKLTLEITLEAPCSDFQALLALPPAMPCNQEFFESTQGRYGLAADCIASNSGYYADAWNYDKWSDEGNYITLRRNTLNPYNENTPYAINIFIDLTDERKDFNEKVLKVYKTSDFEEITELKKSHEYSEYETAVWGFIFNLDGEFSNQSYRLNLAEITDFSVSEVRYQLFSCVIPPTVCLGNLSYRELVEDTVSASGSDSQVGALAGMKLIMPQGTGLRTDMGRIMQSWQSKQGFYCSIAELEAAEYKNALENGDFDIALVKLSGEYNSPYAYLNDFLENNSSNYSGYESKKYSHIINSALTAQDSETAAVFYKEAEQLLIDSGVFIPLCIETEYVFYEEKSEAILYNPFSGVYSVK